MRYQSLIDLGFMDWLLLNVFCFKAGSWVRELRARRNFVIPNLSSGPHLALCRIGKGSASRDGLLFLYLSRTIGRYHDGVHVRVIEAWCLISSLEKGDSPDKRDIMAPLGKFGVAKISRLIYRLFLRLLNFTPELLAKTQEEAELQRTSIDVLIRDALEKHLKDLKVASEEEKESDTREYARLVLRAHFLEDRNEFLTEDAIRWIGKQERYP